MKVWTNALFNSKCAWQKHLGPGVAPAVAVSLHVIRGLDSNDNLYAYRQTNRGQPWTKNKKKLHQLCDLKTEPGSI